jgi:hypothetical protein
MLMQNLAAASNKQHMQKEEKKRRKIHHQKEEKKRRKNGYLCLFFMRQIYKRKNFSRSRMFDCL